MKIAIKNIEGKKPGELEVKFPLIEDGKGTQAVHDVVVAYQAAQRMGTACTKNVGEVPAPTRNRGGKRARAAPAPVPSSRRCGSAAAWSLVRGPVISQKSFQEHTSPRVAQGVERTAQGRRRGDGGRFETGFAEDEGFRRLMSTLELTGTTLIVAPGRTKTSRSPRATLRRYADHERFAEHLRHFAARQTALHQERV